MNEIFVFTIVYYKDGVFYMISSNCFMRPSDAERCAREFCKLRDGEGSLFNYEIEN